MKWMFSFFFVISFGRLMPQWCWGAHRRARSWQDRHRRRFGTEDRGRWCSWTVARHGITWYHWMCMASLGSCLKPWRKANRAIGLGNVAGWHPLSWWIWGAFEECRGLKDISESYVIWYMELYNKYWNVYFFIDIFYIRRHRQDLICLSRSEPVLHWGDQRSSWLQETDHFDDRGLTA